MRRWLFLLSVSLLLLLLALTLLSEFTRIHYSSSSGPPQIELDLARSALTVTRDGAQMREIGYSTFYFEEGWTFTRRYLGAGRGWLPSIDTVTWACRTTTVTVPLWIPLAAAAVVALVTRPRA